MPKVKIFYILSLVILGALIAFTIFRPMASGGKYSEVQRQQLLQKEDEWIIQLDIMNHEGRDQNYNVTVMEDGKPYSENVLIPDGRIFTYIHHIYTDRVSNGDFSLTIYREGEAIPIEEATYYLK